MHNLATVTSIAVAGALGTLARWGLSGLSHRLLGDRFAWGTLAVNLIGCLVLGFLMEAVLSGTLIPRALRLPLAVGFCGAFTTFSTFGYETLRYIQAGNWLYAAGNTALNVILGLGMVWLGFILARAISGGA